MIHCTGWGRKMAQAELSGAIVAVAVVLVAGSASVANECAGLPRGHSLASRLSPDIHEQEQHGIAARATYEALLAAGAPETLACAAALNPQVFQTVGPIYLRPSR
jgi:hypothetical protein